MAKGYKTGGRKKGTPNKISADVKNAIECAFEEVGGAAYLVTVARDEPRTFCALLGKLLPNINENDNTHDLSDPLKELLASVAESRKRVTDRD